MNRRGLLKGLLLSPLAALFGWSSAKIPASGQVPVPAVAMTTSPAEAYWTGATLSDCKISWQIYKDGQLISTEVYPIQTVNSCGCKTLASSRPIKPIT